MTDDEDYIQHHRGMVIASPRRGAEAMMAELFGTETGYCKGKGGSMHIAAFDKGILGAWVS